MNQPDWRYWARRYATAAMLTLAQLSVPIAGHLRSRPAVVRLFDHRQRGRFDAREMVAPETVLTVPLTLDQRGDGAPSERGPFELN